MIGNNPNHNNDNADQNVPQDAANWASPHASKVLSIPDNPQETNKQINKSNTQLLSIVKAILLAGKGVISASTPGNNAGQQNNRTSTVSDEPNQKREITMDNLMNQQIPITLNQLLQLLSKNDKKVLAPWTLANFQHPPIDDLAQYIVDIIEQPISKGSQNGIEIHTNNSDEKFFANSRGKGIPGPPNGQKQFSLKLKPDKGSLNSYMGDVKSQKISSDSGGMQVGLGTPTPANGRNNRYFGSNTGDMSSRNCNIVGNLATSHGLDKLSIEQLLDIKSRRIDELRQDFKKISDLAARFKRARELCRQNNMDKTELLEMIEEKIKQYINGLSTSTQSLPQDNSSQRQGQDNKLLKEIGILLADVENQLERPHGNSPNQPSPSQTQHTALFPRSTNS